MFRSLQAWLMFALVASTFILSIQRSVAATLTGTIIDATSRQPVGARIYIQAQNGEWHFPQSSADGSAIPYKKNPAPASQEMHTTLSPHPFHIDLAPGEYTVTIERGKEYFPLIETITVRDYDQQFVFPLRRWINMAARRWYSGDTHTHRTMEELENLLIAEDVNVVHPMNYWTMNAFESPRTSPRSVKKIYPPAPIYVDAQHAIYPVNTEYELFHLKGKPHTLGAILLLNHKNVLDEGAPPIGPIAKRIQAEGGLIAFDKHNWEWSMMLPPVARNDLFDLANNHMWRTEFRFKDFGVPAPAYMRLPPNESGWIHYGFQTYYALLNAGFNMMPTGGTGAGFHPAPFGFGRVYVHCPEGFTYERWVEGLKKGRSFVSTGPMLFLQGNLEPPGKKFTLGAGGTMTLRLKGTAEFLEPLTRVEIIVNGTVHENIAPENKLNKEGAFESSFSSSVKISRTSWVAVRALQERPGGALRFAHSSPFMVQVGDQPMQPRREEVEFLIARMEAELKRNAAVLPPEALEEFKAALAHYQNLLPR